MNFKNYPNRKFYRIGRKNPLAPDLIFVEKGNTFGGAEILLFLFATYRGYCKMNSGFGGNPLEGLNPLKPQKTEFNII